MSSACINRKEGVKIIALEVASSSEEGFTPPITIYGVDGPSIRFSTPTPVGYNIKRRRRSGVSNSYIHVNLLHTLIQLCATCTCPTMI